MTTTPAALRSAPAPGSSEPAGTAAAPSPAAATAAPSGPAGGPSGSAAAPPAEAASPAGRSAGERTTTPQRLEARRLKTPDRVSVRLEFSLPKAERIFVIVRGPSPSCRIAGYIPIRGRKGPNTVAFAGRVHGRRLEPGVYLISLSPNRRLVPGAPTEYVQVVSPRRSIPLPDSARRPSCREASALATDATARILIAEAVPPPATPTVRPTLRPIPPRPPAHQGAPKDDDEEEAAGFIPYSGVLGAATGEGAEEPFVAFAMLTIMAAFLIAILMLVTRLLRGTRNS